MFFVNDSIPPSIPVADSVNTQDAPGMAFERVVAKRGDRWLALVSDIAAAEELPQPPSIHKLRVASRRLLVTLRFLGLIDASSVKRLQRLIKPLRSVAGEVRDCDVHAALLRELLENSPLSSRQPSTPDALAMIATDRDDAAARLRAICCAVDVARSRRRFRKLTALSTKLRDEKHLLETIRSRVTLSEQSLAAAWKRQPQDATALHDVRLAIKDLRYSRELLAAAAGKEYPPRPELIIAQARLGELNDVATLAERLDQYARLLDLQHESEKLAATKALVAGLRSLKHGFNAVFQRRSFEFARWWQYSWQEEMSTVEHQPNLCAESPPPLNATATSRRGSASMQFSTGPDANGLLQDLSAAEIDEDPARIAPALNPTVNVVKPATTGAALDGEQSYHSPTFLPPGEGGLWLVGWTVSIIDIGSNSVRMLVAQVHDDRTWTTLAEERAMTRLAHGLGESKELCQEAIGRSLDALSNFIALSALHHAAHPRIFATAAVRDASNGSAFIAAVKARTGLDVEVVSSQEEGRLTHASVARVVDLTHCHAAIADLGGGSLEVVRSIKGVVINVTSLPLGTVVLSEKFGGPLASSGPAFASMRKSTSRMIRQAMPSAQSPDLLVGCGGTFTTILSLAAGAQALQTSTEVPAALKQVPDVRVTAYAPGPLPYVTRKTVRQLLKQLKALPLEERERIPGLHPDRADIIVAGLLTVERLMKHLHVQTLHVHTGGIREGLLLRLIDERLNALSPEVTTPASQSAAILRRADALASSALCEQPHSKHVTRLALALYDALLSTKVMKDQGAYPLERTLLQAAAMLHDCGVLVSFANHHKHSADIIRNFGLCTRDANVTPLVALVARYHRKTGPTTRHRAFATLHAQDQDLVTRLAAILRVADGLDRSHQQLVQGLTLAVGKSSLRIVVHPSQQGAFGPLSPPPSDLTAELAAAMTKADVLERVTHLHIDVIESSENPGVVQASPAAAAGGANRGL